LQSDRASVRILVGSVAAQETNMKQEIIRQLFNEFEQIWRSEAGVEFCLARDLQIRLGYTTWESFAKVIEKARTACGTSGQGIGDHFREVIKTVDLGLGKRREIDDVALTRYACYLVAQNGDPRKEPIAFAQTYFAVQTRKQEVVEQRLEELERLQAREKLSSSERSLSGIIYERLHNNESFGRIRSMGDQALFGGHTTQDMKHKLGVPQGRPLADFLPTITIKAKDFANEITNFSIKRDDLKSEPDIADEHVKNNHGVRNVLLDRGIKPESLSPAEDIRKLERRVKAERKKLPNRLATDSTSSGDNA